MNPSLPETLYSQQRAFTAHLRDPKGCPPPADVAPARMALYRELFLNNVTATLEEAFSPARSLIPEREWLALVERFFAEHRSRTPILARLPGEFVDWYAGCVPAQLPAWLEELLRHEWLLLERALVALPAPARGEPADPLTAVPRLSPLARLEAYRYPVHLIGPEFRPEGPGEEPTRLALWRDHHHRVQAVALNPASARLLELAAAGEGRSGRRLLERIAIELRHPEPQVVVAGGEELLAQFYRRGLLIPTEV